MATGTGDGAQSNINIYINFVEEGADNRFIARIQRLIMKAKEKEEKDNFILCMGKISKVQTLKNSCRMQHFTEKKTTVGIFNNRF